MQLEQAFDVTYPLPVVWRAFEDLRATASCIPGAAITNVEDNRKASGVFRVQLGPIKAAFAGDAEVTRDEAAHSGTIKGTGRDGKSASRVNASVVYQLLSVNDHTTRIALKVDYSMTGTLAQFSRGSLVKEIAASITKIFAGNLEKMLAVNAAPAPTSASERTTATPQAAPSVHTEPQSLNVFTLVLSAVGRWIAGLFRSGPK